MSRSIRIGVGTRGKAPYPAYDQFGNLTFVEADVEIDEKMLQQIATQTGGRYFRATDKQSLREIYDQINRMEKSKISVTDYTARTEECTPWILSALVLLLLEFLLRTLVLKRIP